MVKIGDFVPKYFTVRSSFEVCIGYKISVPEIKKGLK
jgi:hypothetical protein